MLLIFILPSQFFIHRNFSLNVSFVDSEKNAVEVQQFRKDVLLIIATKIAGHIQVTRVFGSVQLFPANLCFLLAEELPHQKNCLSTN